MARDFDFKPRTTSAKRPIQPNETAVATPKPAVRYREQKKKGVWSILLLIIGLLGVGLAIYYQFGANQSVSSNGSMSNDPIINLDAVEPSQIKVGIYASDTDLSVCRDLANNISTMGYVASCVGQSLASHSQTEIWAIDALKSESQKINEAQGLNANVQTLNTESRYQIVIYIAES